MHLVQERLQMPSEKTLPLTTFQERVLREYKRRRKPRGRIHDKNAHVTIRTSVCDWLARKDIWDLYKLAELDVAEIVALVDLITLDEQIKRNKKVRETIKKNKKRDAKMENEARQYQMDL
jgi:hypothetical protein